MKGKIAWLGLSGLVLAILLLVACAPQPTTPVPAPIPAPAPATVPAPLPTPITPGNEMVKDSLGRLVEKPLYGGTLTDLVIQDISTFDQAYSVTTASLADPDHLICDKLLQVDWLKGPSGTRQEMGILSGSAWVSPMQGRVAESWEIPDRSTVVFHIRPGIHWQNKPPVNGRELTAADVAFIIDRNATIPTAYVLAQQWPGWYVSANATDKYTVVIKCNDTATTPTLGAFQNLGGMMALSAPPESIKLYGNVREWKNVVGTGPFILTDYVPASSLTFEKNPNYWLTDPMHPTNKLPYVDEVKWLVIVDPSTEFAALRTAKLDVMLGTGSAAAVITFEDKETLIKYAPQLKFVEMPSANTRGMVMRTDVKPFDDIRVRKAMRMAIDLQTITKTFYGRGKAEMISEPVSIVTPNCFTPYDQLPPDVKETYTYNPTKAKQLLADAGYPDGFKTSVVCIQTPDVDQLSVFKSYLAQVGIDLTLDVRDYAVHNSIYRAKTFPQMVHRSLTMINPYKLVSIRPGIPGNASKVDDPYINERFAKLWALENVNNQAFLDQTMKEIAMRSLGLCLEVQFPSPYYDTLWWPWVKAYNGEVNWQYFGQRDYAQLVWIDQTLKKSIIGR